mgnify:CR=1 FL=1
MIPLIEKVLVWAGEHFAGVAAITLFLLAFSALLLMFLAIFTKHP